MSGIPSKRVSSTRDHHHFELADLKSSAATLKLVMNIILRGRSAGYLLLSGAYKLL